MNIHKAKQAFLLIGTALTLVGVYSYGIKGALIKVVYQSHHPRQ